jgi:CRP/FNR family transcriptional regulator, cyclic AMP receptor protein
VYISIHNEEVSMPAWPILSALTEEQRRAVLSAARRRRFAHGEVVFHRDDPAETLHLVSSGCFAVRVITRLGEVATLSLVGPGDCFGELALVRPDAVRSATVHALQAGETHSLLRSDLDRLRRTHPQIDAFLVNLLAERVAELTDRLMDALYTPAPQRVSRMLEQLAERYADGSGTASIPLTQEDLAGLAGTSRITVSRVLGDLRRRGLVEIRRGRITLGTRAGSGRGLA